ncbi:WD40 repeat domain-containing protein [Psychrosphaera sp. B3R10]|uniref:WD40 repeat domain-containing protein n=1 Tax=unclassified Psychrosphaera TaxID=2641570 RepID=UPI001C0967FA|nr:MULTISPECIES: WD40 repeat domain-containing protein [unclassified Psychrosphaera]MBU2881142.1 WD40 repeat domain-containing protein [Psychrosphaera sp. I2R16]MBU2988247.1 WD40 repeat domain-containing protein [Psychrosphaera sp. B3R10]
MRILLLTLVCYVLVACGGTEPLKEIGEPYQLTELPLLRAQFTAHGETAVTLSQIDVTLWNIKNEQPIFSHLFSPENEEQFFVALAKNQQVLATAGKQTVTLFDVKKNQLSLAWKVYGTVEHAAISTLAVNSHGDKVVVGLSDGSISVTDVKSKTRLLYQPHLSEIQFLFFNQLENKLITAGVDGRLVVLSLDTGVIEQEYEFLSRITALHVEPRTGNVFASDALGNEIITHIDNIHKSKSLSYIERNQYFRQARFINQSLLVTSNSKNKLTVWNLENGKEVASGNIKALTASSSTSDLVISGSSILSLSTDGIVQNWPIPSI